VVPADIDLTRVPNHIACVMDGNGRWATQRGLKRTEGHAAGEEALFDTVEGALELGVRWLTVYAFSTENWRRPVDEVRYLMGFNESILVRHREDLREKGVRIRFAGRRDWRVPKRLVKQMDESIERTKHGRTMNLVIAFNYGGRAEIVGTVRGSSRGHAADKITDRRSRNTSTARHARADLVVRTSKCPSRTSLWELRTAARCSTTVLWQTSAAPLRPVRQYQARTRRFGGIDG
jgi:undecaprenyl diphosphate synthase